MPIEIKEVIIKTKVEKEPPVGVHGEEYFTQFEDMKNDVLKACELLIKKVLKEQTGR